jgi:hypothetical protein
MKYKINVILTEQDRVIYKFSDTYEVLRRNDLILFYQEMIRDMYKYRDELEKDEDFWLK